MEYGHYCFDSLMFFNANVVLDNGEKQIAVRQEQIKFPPIWMRFT